MARSRKQTSPFLNIFWLALFLPVLWILTRLKKHDLPWIDYDPAA